MVNAKSAIDAVSSTGPILPKRAVIALCTYGAPAASLVMGFPDTRHINAVAEQMTSVSRKNRKYLHKALLYRVRDVRRGLRVRGRAYARLVREKPAPGPPKQIAVETPMMLPVPTREAVDTISA